MFKKFAALKGFGSICKIEPSFIFMKQITALLSIILLSAGFAFSEELDLRLTGTITGGDNTFAFIEVIATGEQGIYRSGDSLKEYRIIEIIKDRITLTQNDREITLIIEGTDPAPPYQGETNCEHSPLIKGDQGGCYKLAANRLADMLNNFSSNKDKVRVYQHHESGRKAGFRIHYLKGGNDFEKMGIENGDIFRKINGLDINDASDIFDAVQKLIVENTFKVEIKRGSQTKILNYRLDERMHYLLPAVSNLLKIPEDSAAY